MEQRISLITLGVDDLTDARRFFESGLGWRPSDIEAEKIVFYQVGSLAFALFDREELAKDAGVSAHGEGFSRVAIAWNGRSEAEVDAAFKKAVAAGAEAVKAPEKVFWGGYSGYIRIPGGHLMELAHNPMVELSDEGHFILPPPSQ